MSLPGNVLLASGSGTQGHGLERGDRRARAQARRGQPHRRSLHPGKPSKPGPRGLELAKRLQHSCSYLRAPQQSSRARSSGDSRGKEEETGPRECRKGQGSGQPVTEASGRHDCAAVGRGSCPHSPWGAGRVTPTLANLSNLPQLQGQLRGRWAASHSPVKARTGPRAAGLSAAGRLGPWLLSLWIWPVWERAPWSLQLLCVCVRGRRLSSEKT